MNPRDRSQESPSRRSFLLCGGGLVTGAWIAAHWPSIAAAAHHAEQMTAVSEPAGFEFFDAAEAADVEAISSQIVPSGATPGAREAHAVFFIDRALCTFFAARSAEFRLGLSDFQARFLASDPASPSFSKISSAAQTAHLKTVDHTPFFSGVRTLTLLGMFASPKYGGNYHGAGWMMMGFKDQHAFMPPFGYYDREYTGFVPYSTQRKS